MKDWKKTLVDPSAPILEAMRIIDAGALQIALVLDNHARLVGIVTDGDIRRGLLKGIALDQPVEMIMNRDFKTVNSNCTHEEILTLMKQKELRHIPVIDEQGHVVGLKLLNDIILTTEKTNWVVLMAGGLGSRLQPLTDECPKPLLKVGNKPLLQTILESFVEHGFRKFYIAVHYKAEMIQKFCGDGSRWNAEIRYLCEDRKMGTAGALGLLPERPEETLFVMNGDVLTKVNWQHLIDFHKSHRAKATMGVRDYHFQFPYGVVKTDQQRLASIDEKPVQHFFVNAGIYVLEPEVLDLIPAELPFDMTTLFEKLIAEKHETVVFPIREYWMDIGRLEDFERADGEYRENFQ
ncbi:MAG: nucleotidyltransferase family protein [Syntrophaceae bacterium]